MELHCPVIFGSGRALPILYGLESMQTQNAVLEMEQGHPRLTFPGPGGYEIRWSPGTKHIPLQTTPSGHLCFTVDNFDELPHQEAGGITQNDMTILHTSAPTSQTQQAEDTTPPAVQEEYYDCE